MPSRQVVFAREASRTLEGMDKTTRSRIVAKIVQLANEPESLTNNVKRLKGVQGQWRLRVGDWRVIYTETLVILKVIKVAPRSSAYD